MAIRTVLVGAAAFVISAASVGAQGAPKKQVVVSPNVVKSMTANKPKSKTSLGSKVGIGRKPSVVAAKTGQAAPTSVREIKPISKKN